MFETQCNFYWFQVNIPEKRVYIKNKNLKSVWLQTPTDYHTQNFDSTTALLFTCIEVQNLGYRRIFCIGKPNQGGARYIIPEYLSQTLTYSFRFFSLSHQLRNFDVKNIKWLVRWEQLNRSIYRFVYFIIRNGQHSMCEWNQFSKGKYVCL